MVSLSVLLGVLSAAGGTWLATAEGNTAQLGAAALVLPNASGATGGGTVTEFAGRPVQATGTPAGPGTSSTAPTTSSQAPTPTETSETPQPTTSAAPAPTTKAPARSKSDGSVAGQVISKVNDERAKAGCKPLTEESHLTKAAQDYSDDMAARNFFAHTNPEGVTFDKRIEAAGYSKPGGENIAKGQTSAAQVMDSWMNSEGHRANILNCSFTKIGVGVTTSDWVWVQDFGY
jgi:uncharacterized protein YkwD